MNFSGDTSWAVSEACKKLAMETDKEILEQLNDLVSRGLLVIEHGPMNFYQDRSLDKLIIGRKVKLTLKSQEYVQSLEKENKELKEALSDLRSVSERVVNLTRGLKI